MKKTDRYINQADQLEADKLRELLWETIADVRSGQCSPQLANAVSKAAKEILSSVRTEVFTASLIGATESLGAEKFFGLTRGHHELPAVQTEDEE